jgi:hypothetical protein
MHIAQHLNRLISATISSTCCMLAIAPQAMAAEMTHGEMAAAIRSADYPCAHVLGLKSTGDRAWSVDCNSGTYLVTREEDGTYTVTQTK